MFLQCGNIFGRGVNGNTQFARDALVGAAILDVKQIYVDIDFEMVQTQIKNFIGKRKIILGHITIYMQMVFHSHTPFV